MKQGKIATSFQKTLLASLLASSFFIQAAETSNPSPTPSPTVTPTPGTSTDKQKTKVKAKVGPRQAQRNWVARTGEYYRRTWGIEIAGVRLLASGSMLEFRYRVVDPVKAKPLTDKRIRPLLYDEANNATLSVPTMDKIGEVRQTGKLEKNRYYYMLFGNPGQIVKPGNRVSVIIGKFRADGIIVN